MGKSSKKAKQKQINQKANQPVSWFGMAALLLLITLLLFSNTFNHGYNMDDNLVTQNHPLTKKGFSAIGEIFNSSYHQDDMGYAFGYRPIVHVSFAIEHELFGESAKTSHVINVLLYALVVVLLFRLLIRWIGTKSLYIPFLVCLLFAVHPIHSEVVASIKNRDEILALLFAIAAGLALSNYVIASKKWYWLPLAALYFSIGMLSKKSIYPLVIVLPFAFTLFANLSLKNLLLLTLSITLPAAFIAAEMNMSRFVLLLFAPVLFVVPVHYICNTIREGDLKSSLIAFINDEKKLTIFYWLCLVTSLLVQFNFITFIAFVIGFVLLYKHTKTALFHVSAGFMALYMTFQVDEFATLAILITAITLFNALKEKLPSKKLILLLVGMVLIVEVFDYFTAYDYYNFNNTLRNFSLILLSFLLVYYPLLTIIYVLSTLSVIYFFFSRSIIFSLDFFITCVYAFGLLALYAKFKNRAAVLKYTPYLLALVFVLTTSFPEKKLFSSNVADRDDMSWVYVQYDEQNQGKGDGRMLDYVENTLVAPHSGQELFATGIAVLGEYARLHVYPKELLFYYGFAKTETVDLTNWWVWVSLLFHLGVVFAGVFFIKKAPLVSLGALWYLLSILLFSNWVQLIAGMVGERLAFTASVGFCLMLVGFYQFFRAENGKFNFKIPEILFFTIILLFGVRTIYRNQDWKDPVTLMSRDIAFLENSAQANNLLALNLMMSSTTNNNLAQNERLQMQRKAVRHFDKATEIWPYFFNAHFDKGRAAVSIGDFEKAKEGFLNTIAIDPSFISPYFFLVDIYRNENDMGAYKRTAKQMVEYHPGSLDAHYFLFNGYLLTQQNDSALIVLEEALRIFPNEESFKMNYKALLEEMN